MLLPVLAAACDLAFEKEPRDVAGVCEGHEQKVHPVRLVTPRETKCGQQRHGLAALREEDGARVHDLEVRKLLGGVGHDEPPQGTCSKNFMPSLTRSFAPGLSGVSWPS